MTYRTFLLLPLLLVAAVAQADNFRPSRQLGPIQDDWPQPTKPQWLGNPVYANGFSYNPPQFSLTSQTLTPAVSRTTLGPHRVGTPAGRRPKRHRRRRLRPRQGASKSCANGAGVCRNFMSCMFSGRRLDWRSTKGACDDAMMGVCCTPWSAKQRQRKRANRAKKSGRALLNAGPPPAQTPNVIKYFTSPDGGSLISDFALNTIEDGSTNQWHTHNVLTSDDEFCGISKNANSRIMGGLDAGYGQFPWTAHIKIKGPDIDKVCGGTLVNRRWVVTAGHCTQYCQDIPNCDGEISQLNIQYKIILGEYDQLSQLEEYPTESYLAVEVIRHPEYRNVMRYHKNGFLESEPRFDVALLKLDRNARIAPNVAPICLPPLNNWAHPVAPAGTQATVVGWGRLGREEDAPHSNVLQAVTVPVLDEHDCAIQTGLGVYPDQLCAGGSDVFKSACPGDSGGGLQVRDDRERWTLIGVVSNGPSTCGLQPVIFHKVEETLPWIVRTMRKHSYKNVPWDWKCLSVILKYIKKIATAPKGPCFFFE